MNAGLLVANAIILVGILPMTNAQASSSDEALCKGSYPVMLMTARECGTYTRQLHTLQSQGHVNALEELQRQHAEQLAERAAICPCMMGQKPEVPQAPQRLVMLESDC